MAALRDRAHTAGSLIASAMPAWRSRNRLIFKGFFSLQGRMTRQKRVPAAKSAGQNLFAARGINP